MLVAGRKIENGTVIATFIRGRNLNLPHGNHAAIFLRYVAGGMEIFDQWLHHSPRKRIIFFKHARQAGVAQSAELYSVVE